MKADADPQCPLYAFPLGGTIARGWQGGGHVSSRAGGGSKGLGVLAGVWDAGVLVGWVWGSQVLDAH